MHELQSAINRLVKKDFDFALISVMFKGPTMISSNCTIKNDPTAVLTISGVTEQLPGITPNGTQFAHDNVIRCEDIVSVEFFVAKKIIAMPQESVSSILKPE